MEPETGLEQARSIGGTSPDLDSSSHHLRPAGNLRAAGDRVCTIYCVRPSLISTGLESNVIVAGFKPSRLAVNLIVPGIKVERMATRLMPHSVLRYRLLVELVLPEL